MLPVVGSMGSIAENVLSHNESIQKGVGCEGFGLQGCRLVFVVEADVLLVPIDVSSGATFDTLCESSPLGAAGIASTGMPGVRCDPRPDRVTSHLRKVLGTPDVGG